MAVWQDSAGVDAPYGKRRLIQLVNEQVPEELPRDLVTTFNRLVTTVNAVTGNERVLAVTALANAARTPACRSLVMDALEGLEEGLEQLLEAREDARTGRPQAWRRDLHEALILLLCRSQSYGLAVTDVLEFARGDVGLCAELLTRLLAVAAYEDEIAEAATRMLFELTLPAAAVAGSGEREHSLAEVASRAEATADLLLSPPGQSLLAAAVAGLGQRLRRAQRLLKAGGPATACHSVFMAVRWLCQFLLNAWSFASPATAERLRGHLRVATQMLPEVAVPGIAIAGQALLPGTVAGGGAAGDRELLPKSAGQCLASALRLVAMLCYRAGGEADAATKAALPVLCRALAAVLHGPVPNSRVLALAMLAGINAHALHPCAVTAGGDAAVAGDALSALDSARAALAEAALASVAGGALRGRSSAVGSLLVQGSAWLPTEKQGPAFGYALALLEGPAGGEEAPCDEAPASAPAPAPDASARESDAAADSPRVQARGHSRAAAASPVQSSPAPDETARKGGDGGDRAPASAGEASGGLDDAATPSTDLRAQSPITREEQRTDSLADGTSLSGAPSLPPISRRVRPSGGGGGLASDAELDVAAAPQHLQREWAERRWRAMQSDRQARDAAVALGHARRSASATKPVPGPVAAPLPAASSATTATSGGRGPVARAAEAAAEAAGVPTAFACALDGHAMRDPVRRRGAASAPVFERAAILAHLARNGNECPVTRIPLAKSDLESCDELRSEIHEWRASLARNPVGARGSRIAVEAATSDELASTMYEF